MSEQQMSERGNLSDREDDIAEREEQHYEDTVMLVPAENILVPQDQQKKEEEKGRIPLSSIVGLVHSHYTGNLP